MNREQKLAWLVVVFAAFAFLVSLVTVYFMYLKHGMPKALLGFNMMGLSGIGGLGWFFIKKKKGNVIYDERDLIIKKNANHAGFVAAFVFAGTACMLPFFILGPDATISVTALPQVWIGIFVSQFIFYSVAILIQYGRGGKENE